MKPLLPRGVKHFTSMFSKFIGNIDLDVENFVVFVFQGYKNKEGLTCP